MPNRGRPPLLSDEVILEAAFAAFAANGYAAMSVRALNADLGLSHETITKRFGPKIDLYRAAVSYGVGLLVADFDRVLKETEPVDDLARLRGTIRAFMVAASNHPTMGDLLHHEGIGGSERTLLIEQSGLGDRLAEAVSLIQRLHAAGVIRETKIREFWFLCQAAVAPLRSPAMAKMFDPFDGPVDPDELLSRMTDAIMRSMGIDDAAR